MFAVSTAVFWRTAYPTITWWDSARYSLAAATLGVTSSPGSLLLTLLGWCVAQLPTGLSAARELSLFAGVLGAATVTLVYLGTRCLLRLTDGTQGDALPAVAGAAIGALTMAFGRTFWEYATQFTPYMLTVVFTALMLLVMLRWWADADRDDAWRWLALLAFLLGLDFSVHRTNALLAPAILGWILLRRASAVRRGASWAAGVGGLTAGLTLHLALMPISAHTRSPLNMFEPSTWPRFWDYVSLSQVGGGFLVDLWPRKSGFVSVQVADFLRALRDSFIAWDAPTYVLGCLPLVAAIVGFGTLWRRNARLGAGMTLVIALHAIITVVYFNIPANYFRSLDRHYLPVIVTIGIVIAFGMCVMAAWVVRQLTRRGPLASAPRAIVALTLVVLAVAPLTQLARNWAANDASRRFFARDFAVGALEELPPNAIFFTVGDNDTFPVMYVQSVEGVRPDVQIVNTSLANTRWYIDQIRRRDPTFPVSGTTRSDRVATDTVSIPVTAGRDALGAAPGAAVPATLRVRPKPMFGGARMLPADWVLLDIVEQNAWRRPLTVSITAGEENLGWLGSYARLDGLYWRIVPVASPSLDRELLRSNLIDRRAYRGYADRSVRLEDVTRTMGSLAYVAAAPLVAADRAAGELDRCLDAVTRLEAKVPFERLELSGESSRELRPSCGAR